MPQELIIRPVLNGFIVQAGCQTLVYNSSDKIIEDFTDWVRDPEKIERRYRELMEKKGICPPPPPSAIEPMATIENVGAVGRIPAPANLRR